ncbi:MAG: M56 family metallopeptidase [Lachnospiraceae bacterium]|nr:M56 family metallopeptidase [Lachnospiraceae bacterium]MCM1240281.1 M56 family metallopeptidase [Lachnospiraceae bacterium]
MTELFLKIVNMSISAGWLILAVILLRPLLKRAPRQITVALWGLVGVRLALPFSIESIFSLIPSRETISPDIMLERTPAVHTGIPALDGAVNPVIGVSLAPAPAASANPLQIWIPILSIIWMMGMAVILSYTAASYWRLRRRVATAIPIKGNLYRSDRVESPFVLGLIRPRIYLPCTIAGRDARPIIAHERAHIRRRDHWWKPLGFLLLTVHWFNPLVWIAYVLLCRDIELACDEKVIRGLDNDQRADYSQALLSCSVSRRGIAACPLAFGEVGVKERVRSVLNYRRPAFWVILAAVVVCAAVALCFLTDPAGQPGPAEPEQQPVAGAGGDSGVPADGYGSAAGEREQSVFQDAAIWEGADLDHDGETELILVREHNGGEYYELEVVKQDGTLLWSREAGTVHTGEAAFLLYEGDGEDYLVEYLPAIYQGMGSYSCTQFSLEGGVETEENQWTADFQLPVQEITGKMRAFAEVGNMIMKDGIVLLGTVGGELVIGPKAAAEVSGLYPVSFGGEDQMPGDDAASGQDMTQGDTNGVDESAQFGDPLFKDGQPLEFLFASGAGAWGTTLTLYPDGRFEGVYEDGEAIAAPEYPRGTSYICRFSGRFSEMTRISDYAYSMQLEELNCETEKEKEWIEDEIRYIGSEAFGVEGGEEFILYLPYTPPEGLDEEFLSWWPDNYLWRDGSVTRLSAYGLHNVNTGAGFFTSWLE